MSDVRDTSAPTDGVLYRSSADLRFEGRTLVGLAIPWDKPARVQDPGSRAYLEAFAPNVFTRSLDNHKGRPFPVFTAHGWKKGDDPIGVATFERSAEGLLYVAPLSRTREADEKLELVKDGAMRSVSVGFEPYKSRQVRTRAHGIVTVRTEAALMELSLAPTGFGMYPEAGVTSVRDGRPAPALDDLDEIEDEEPQPAPKREALAKQLSRLTLPPPRG